MKEDVVDKIDEYKGQHNNIQNKELDVICK